MTKYVIAEGQIDPVELEIEATATVDMLAAMVAERFGLPKDELLVFVEDMDEPVSLAAIVQEAAPDDRCFHVHRCAHIGVAVSYNTKTIAGDFRPSATIGRLRNWAVKELLIPSGDAACLRLQLEDGTFPSERAHVGQFTSHSHCGVVLRLAEHKKPQG